MNTKRLLQPQILIAILLLLLLVGVVIFANRSSDGPNSGTESIEVWGIVLNQKGTCAQVPPVFSNSGTLCTHALVLGRNGECVTFVFNNFSPHAADPKAAKMSLCKRHGLHASS